MAELAPRISYKYILTQEAKVPSKHLCPELKKLRPDLSFEKIIRS